MATHFLAFATRVRDGLRFLPESVSLDPTDLIEVYTSPHLRVLTNDINDVTVLSDAGVLIGTVFERQGSYGRPAPDHTDLAARARGTGGESLFQDLWGGYVAFLELDDAREIHVIRDPSGAFPCLYLQIGGVRVIASDAETLLEAGFLKTTINWAAIRRHFYAPDLKSTETALIGCKELLPGHRLSLTFSGDLVKPVWTPWSFVAPRAWSNSAQMVDELRETIDLCVNRWAARFQNILLGVSGGLDSSIIAACLDRQDTPWTAMTMATHAAEGDERNYARQLTDHLGRSLVERFHNLSDVDISATSSGHLPRPFGLIFGQSQDRAKQVLANEFGFDAFFTGQGGDNIFCYMQSATPLVDRLCAEGLSLGAWTTMRDIARLTQTSLLDVAIHAARRMARRDPTYLWPRHGNLLSTVQDAELPQTLHHPWLEAPARALPGKAVHIAKLLRIQSTVDGYSRKTYGPLVTPLLAQPLVEVCLSIPTWQWSSGGINRSIVRDAFADRLPRSLIERQSKAGPVSFAFEVIESNRGRLKELLLDGLLASENIIDRRGTEALLDDGSVIRPPAHNELMMLAEAEAWARHWSKVLGHPAGASAQAAVQQGTAPPR